MARHVFRLLTLKLLWVTMRQKTPYIADELPNSFSKFHFLKKIIFRGEANTHLTPYPYSGYRFGS